MYWVALAMWAALAVATTGAPSPVQQSSIRVKRQGPFGNSIFDGEEIELSPIGDIEYEYTAEDYADEPIEKEDDLDELYDEEEYGDYDEKFIEPVRNEADYEYDESAGPFGNSIFNLDDIETSPIADIEYEYDYEDYNDIDDTMASKNEPPTKTIVKTQPKIVKPIKEPPIKKRIPIKPNPELSYNFKPIYQQHPPKFSPQPTPPKFNPKPRPASAHHTQPNYGHRFTPAELYYMYGKPRKQKPSPKPNKVTASNPINSLVKKLRKKMVKIVRFVTERIRNPKKLLNFN